MPSLSMIVDRTSLDETNDFGVDQDALQSSSWSKDQPGDEYFSSAMVMKNGKVRRKMKWRPKSMMKKRREGIPTLLPKRSSSSASVMSSSNASSFSKQSKKSVHSFSSTQTEKKTNTQKARSRAPPLPRPNYPSSLTGVSTIGNEGEQVFNKMSPTRTPPLPKRKYQIAGKRKIKPSSSWRSRLPPLPGSGRGNASAPPSPNATFSSVDTTFHSASSESSTEREMDQDHLPTLSGTDDAGRRVDLRVRTPQLFSKAASSDDFERPLLMRELKSSSNLEKDGENKLELYQSDSGFLDSPDNAFLSRPESPPLPSNELNPEMRFRMNHLPDVEERPPTIERGSVPTCPVDVDDGSFLEAEKNLQAIHQMASEHLKHGEYAEALDVFEEILRGQLTRYGPDHQRVGTALHNIGIVHMKSGDYANAIEVCKEAVLVRKSALGPSHQDVAESLAQLGVAYLESKKNKKAVIAFREALKIRRNGLAPNHAKVSKILNNIGCALYEMDELEVAKVAFEEALEVQRQTLKDHGEHAKEDHWNQNLLSVASTLSNIGSIKLYWGHYDDALVDLEEALLLQQSVLGDGNPVSQRTQESLEFIHAARRVDEGEGKLPATRNAMFAALAGATGNEEEDLLLCNTAESRDALLLQNRKLLETLEQFQASFQIDCGVEEESSFSMEQESSSFGRKATF